MVSPALMDDCTVGSIIRAKDTAARVSALVACGSGSGLGCGLTSAALVSVSLVPAYVCLA